MRALLAGVPIRCRPMGRDELHGFVWIAGVAMTTQALAFGWVRGKLRVDPGPDGRDAARERTGIPVAPHDHVRGKEPGVTPDEAIVLEGGACEHGARHVRGGDQEQQRHHDGEERREPDHRRR
jgi:hypothetical protein